MSTKQFPNSPPGNATLSFLPSQGFQSSAKSSRRFWIKSNFVLNSPENPTLKIPTIPEQMLLAAAGSSITLPRKLEDILIFLSEQEDWIYAADMVVCAKISPFSG
jgi:hypothetical protein